MKVCLFGGTFDPPHIGHLIIAETVQETEGFDKMIFVPASIPPHKTKTDLSTIEDRMAMLRLALKGNENFPLFEVALATNLKIISDMAKAVQRDGAKLILVDATKNLPRYGQLPAALVAKIMEKFCQFNDIGYIPLHDRLNKSRKDGVNTHWIYDHHFNETGNKIFSDSMFSYLNININN